MTLLTLSLQLEGRDLGAGAVHGHSAGCVRVLDADSKQMSPAVVGQAIVDCLQPIRGEMPLSAVLAHAFLASLNDAEQQTDCGPVNDDAVLAIRRFIGVKWKEYDR